MTGGNSRGFWDFRRSEGAPPQPYPTIDARHLTGQKLARETFRPFGRDKRRIFVSGREEP